MKRTANIEVAVAAAVYKAWRQNHLCSLRQKGSGYIAADFQAKKVWIVIPGHISVMDNPPVKTVNSPGSNGGKGIKLTHSLFADFCHYVKSELQYQTCRCPRAASRQAYAGLCEPSPKTSKLQFLTVDGLLR
jgi:hypothetical protein